MIIPTLHRILVKADKLEETDKTFVQARKIGIVIPENEDRKRAQAGVDKGIVVVKFSLCQMLTFSKKAQRFMIFKSQLIKCQNLHLLQVA